MIVDNADRYVSYSRRGDLLVWRPDAIEGTKVLPHTSSLSEQWLYPLSACAASGHHLGEKSTLTFLNSAASSWKTLDKTSACQAR